jgi:hypothetical protein
MKNAKSFEISRRLVMEAYGRVRANRGTAGVDNISIADFENNLKGFFDNIDHELLIKALKRHVKCK